VPVDNTRQLLGFRKGVIVDGLAFQPFFMVFWAIHKLYASKHISRGEVVVTTLAKASPGNLTGKKKVKKGEAGAAMDVAIVA